MTIALRFKARMDPLACEAHCLHAKDSLESSLVQHLLTSWQSSCLLYLLIFSNIDGNHNVMFCFAERCTEHSGDYDILHSSGTNLQQSHWLPKVRHGLHGERTETRGTQCLSGNVVECSRISSPSPLSRSDNYCTRDATPFFEG